VIQQSQTSAAAAVEEAKKNRGTGRPTLPAPSMHSMHGKGRNKGKNKDNIIGRAKESEFNITDLLCDPHQLNLLQALSGKTISSI